MVIYIRICWNSAGNEERARLLIRAIYRLALAGIDVNARDASGRTALVLAALKSSDEYGNVDQSLLTHLLRIGQFAVYELTNHRPRSGCGNSFGRVCLSVCRVSRKIT